MLEYIGQLSVYNFNQIPAPSGQLSVLNVDHPSAEAEPKQYFQ